LATPIVRKVATNIRIKTASFLDDNENEITSVLDFCILPGVGDGDKRASSCSHKSKNQRSDDDVRSSTTILEKRQKEYCRS